MIGLSIVIANWNAAEHLRQCLHSIYESGARLSFEMIVVDNASTDGSVAMLCEDLPQVRLMRQDVSSGFAGSNNVALSVARGRAVQLLNSDTVLSPGTLDAMMRFLDRYADAGILGPRGLNRDGTLEPSCRDSPSLRPASALAVRLLATAEVALRLGYWSLSYLGRR